MRKIYCTIFILLFALQLLAQSAEWQDILQRPVSHHNLSSQLYQFGKLALTHPQAAFEKCTRANMLTRADGKIYIELQYGWNPEANGNRNFFDDPYFEFHLMAKNLVGGWIYPKDLLAFAESIEDPAYLLTCANRFSQDHEGVTATGAFTWQAAGVNGAGIKIAIIDGGYSLLSDAQAAGTAPASPIIYDHIDDGNPFESGTVHGTGVAETIFEYAPAATYYLHKASTTVQFAEAIDTIIANNADIIVRSSSNFNTGWADGSGATCAIVKEATDAGILFFNGAGNFNLDHAQASFSDTDGDDLHNWAPGINGNATVLEPDETVSVNLQWLGTLGLTNNFDLILRDSQLNVIAVSNSLNDYESLTWTNTTSTDQTVFIEVMRSNSNKKQFEIFVLGHRDVLTFNQTGSSTASPANSLEPFCITSSVVHWSDYNDPNPPLEPFCSIGPTNNGNAAIDFCTLDNQVLVSYPNGFQGASAGGPNLAGITALLWSEHDYLSAEGILELLKGLASTYNDWGAPGFDDLYGHGAPFFPAFYSNGRFIIKGTDNSSNSTALPFESIEQADALAPSGSNVQFIGGTYDAPAVGQGVISKKMILRAAGEDAVVKD